MGEIPRWVTRCRATIDQTRPASGKSGAPSYLRRFHGEAAVHVHRALRPAGRAGRVDDHVRIFGGHIGECLIGAAPACHDVVPPHVALAQAHLAPEPPGDDHRADGCSVGGGVGRLLHPHHLAAPAETVGGDEHARLTVAQPTRDRLRSVSREDRRVDRPDRRDGERRNRAFGDHGKEDPHAVSGTDAERAEACRKAAHRRRELAVAEPPRRALLALEHQRGPGRIVAERRGHVVHATADPPRGPRNAA